MSATDRTRTENPARARNQEDPSFPIVSKLTAALQASGALKGKTVAWHCHLTLLTELAAGAVAKAGAKLIFSECNPATTQMEAVENLRKIGKVFLGENSARQAAESKPDILADTGYVLIPTFLSSRPEEARTTLLGASEITTSGITKLRADRENQNSFPVFNINDGQIKSLIENFHGVGDGLLEALRLQGAPIEQTRVAVVGYGKVGAGCAHYLKANGARVTVVEIDPVASLLAHFDGYELETLEEALKKSRILVTATGKAGLLGKEHYLRAADGILIANVGHLSSEVSPEVLEALCESKVEKRNGLTQYHLKGSRETGASGGSRIDLLTGGNPCNVALLTGSDAPTMLHLTTEILTWDYIAGHCRPGTKQELPSGPGGECSLPPDVETLAARIALGALGYQFYA